MQNSKKVIFSVNDIMSTWKISNYSVGDLVDISKIISTTCAARPSGYQHMAKFKAGMWDGYIRLAKGNSLPSGLVHYACENLEEAGYACECTYTCVYPDLLMLEPVDTMLDGIVLRDYQLAAISDLIRRGRGVARMATNSGKTEVMAAICKMINCSALILTTKKDLLYQTSERISKRLNEDVSVIGDGHYESDKRITVGMIQTLSQHPELIKELQRCNCAMFDECHHLSSSTAQSVMMKLHSSMRFGFSGTPLKNDLLSDLMLIAATGPVVVDVSNADLIDVGVSAKPAIEMHVIAREASKTAYKLSWKDSYDKFIVHNDARNNLVASLVNPIQSGSVLVLVERLDHGAILEKLISESKFISGSASMDVRKTATIDLGRGGGVKVISTPIFDEGVDLPAVDVLVLAGGGKAFVKILQRLGRGMRHKEGRNTLRVIDFVDDTSVVLMQHSIRRAEVYENEGFDVKIVEQ